MHCNRVLVVFVVLAALLSCGPRALAADDDAWRFSVTPYLWLPSIHSSLGLENIPTDVTTSDEAYNLIDNLDFAFLGNGEIAKGKVGFLFDIQTIKLSNPSSVTVNGLEHKATSNLTIADGTFALEYRLVAQDQFTLDGFGGARILYGDIGLDIDPAGGDNGFSSSGTKTWIDPIVGVKARYRFNNKWSIDGYGDIGGGTGESALTYQVIATVRYCFNEHFGIDAGYRVFFDKFEKGDYKLDVCLYGPVVGVTFAF